MAELKLTDPSIPEETTLPGDTLFYVVKNGISSKITKDSLVAIFGGAQDLTQVLSVGDRELKIYAPSTVPVEIDLVSGDETKHIILANDFITQVNLDWTLFPSKCSFKITRITGSDVPLNINGSSNGNNIIKTLSTVHIEMIDGTGFSLITHSAVGGDLTFQKVIENGGTYTDPEGTEIKIDGEGVTVTAFGGNGVATLFRNGISFSKDGKSIFINEHRINFNNGALETYLTNEDCTVDGQNIKFPNEPETTVVLASRKYVDDIAVSKADLISGFVPSSQLPSYVDDVVEGIYVNTTTFNVSGSPVTLETGKIYLSTDNNRQYRFGGSVLIQVTNGLIGSTSDVPEGTNLYHTAARVLAAVLSGLSTATGGAIVSTDTILQAFGKIQYQITNLSAIYQVILTDSNLGTLIHSFTAKTTPVAADGILISDSADSWKSKFLSFTNLFALLNPLYTGNRYGYLRFHTAAFSPADSTSYWIGNTNNLAPLNASGRGSGAPLTGGFIEVSVSNSVTSFLATGNESSTLKIHNLTLGTQVTVTAALKFTNAENKLKASVALTYNDGDEIQPEIVSANFVTQNPTNCYTVVELNFRKN